MVAQAATTTGGSLGGVLLGFQGLVKPVAKAPRQVGEIGMM